MRLWELMLGYKDVVWGCEVWRYLRVRVGSSEGVCGGLCAMTVTPAPPTPLTGLRAVDKYCRLSSFQRKQPHGQSHGPTVTTTITTLAPYTSARVIVFQHPIKGLQNATYLFIRIQKLRIVTPKLRKPTVKKDLWMFFFCLFKIMMWGKLCFKFAL